MISTDDDTTLKELIVEIQEFLLFAWKKPLIVILFVILGVSLGILKAYTSKTSYSAELTFMINEDDGGGVGGVGAILGQFGFGGGSSEHNLDKIIELSKSRKILQGVIFDSITISGQKNSIGNHIINVYDLHQVWEEEEKEDLHGFYFTDQSEITNEIIHNTAAKNIYSILAGSPKEGVDGLVRTVSNDLTGILYINAITESEELSLGLTKNVYNSLSQFYIENSIEKHLTTFEQLSQKADSVISELSSVEYRLAKIKDRSSGIIDRRNRLEENKLQRDVQILTVLYGEVLKNKETASFVVSNSTPFFQTVDVPTLPLSKDKISMIRSIIIFSMIAFILCFSFLILWYIIAKALR
jgi:uncharacterized protein involved in exopolysaccharide biosynthesis